MPADDVPDGILELDASRRAGIERLRELPPWHPASPDYRPGVRLTDVEHFEHVADVTARLADARAAGLDSRVRHTIDERHEVWSDERELEHDAIIDDLYGAAAAVPCELRAVLAGGPPGSGKTTVLHEHAGIDVSRYLMINPDTIKEQLASRRLMPDLPELTPMEATELVHEESSHIAKRLAHRAVADGKNIIWDVTMSRVESSSDRIGALRTAGYAPIDGIFVDIPIEVSLLRADLRYRREHESYRAGIGGGGRFVPAEMIKAQADERWGSTNRANFEQVKWHCDSWARYDNSGSAPMLADVGRPDSGRRRKDSK